MPFDKLPSIKLTFDTDDDRANYNPTFVIDKNGRKIIFYEKRFKSGRLSDSRVKKTASFSLSVDAGNGEINGTSVAWASDTLTATPNTFELVYVDTAGNIGITDSFPMSFVQSVIVLAYINSGSSEIVTVAEVEKTGKYIYNRRQVLSGGSYVWDDNEYIVNIGEKPRAFFDAANDKIYLTYHKDNSSYIRIFDVNDPTTWSFLPNIVIISGQISKIDQPSDKIIFQTAAGIKSRLVKTAEFKETRDFEQDSFSFQTASGQRVRQKITSNTFSLGSTGLGFIEVGGSFEPHIWLPYVLGTRDEFLFYIVGDVTYKIFSEVGGIYTLEDSVTISGTARDASERWHQWAGAPGAYYIGISVTVNRDLIGTDFETDSEFYVPIRIYDPFDETSFDAGSDTYDVDARDNVVAFKTAAGFKSSLTKTAEFEETQDFEQDSFSFQTAAGLKMALTITSI